MYVVGEEKNNVESQEVITILSFPLSEHLKIFNEVVIRKEDVNLLFLDLVLHF